MRLSHSILIIGILCALATRGSQVLDVRMVAREIQGLPLYGNCSAIAEHLEELDRLFRLLPLPHGDPEEVNTTIEAIGGSGIFGALLDVVDPAVYIVCVGTEDGVRMAREMRNKAFGIVYLILSNPALVSQETGKDGSSFLDILASVLLDEATLSDSFFFGFKLISNAYQGDDSKITIMALALERASERRFFDARTIPESVVQKLGSLWKSLIGGHIYLLARSGAMFAHELKRRLGSLMAMLQTRSFEQDSAKAFEDFGGRQLILEISRTPSCLAPMKEFVSFLHERCREDGSVQDLLGKVQNLEYRDEDICDYAPSIIVGHKEASKLFQSRHFVNSQFSRSMRQLNFLLESLDALENVGVLAQHLNDLYHFLEHATAEKARKFMNNSQRIRLLVNGSFPQNHQPDHQDSAHALVQDFLGRLIHLDAGRLLGLKDRILREGYVLRSLAYAGSEKAVSQLIKHSVTNIIAIAKASEEYRLRMNRSHVARIIWSHLKTGGSFDFIKEPDDKQAITRILPDLIDAMEEDLAKADKEDQGTLFYLEKLRLLVELMGDEASSLITTKTHLSKLNTTDEVHDDAVREESHTDNDNDKSDGSGPGTEDEPGKNDSNVDKPVNEEHQSSQLDPNDSTSQPKDNEENQLVKDNPSGETIQTERQGKDNVGHGSLAAPVVVLVLIVSLILWRLHCCSIQDQLDGPE